MHKLLLLQALLFCFGCSERIRAYADYDESFELNDYSTYGWARKLPVESGKDSVLNNEVIDKKIGALVKRQLDVRGYSLTTEEPAFKVFYHIIFKDQSTIEPYGYNYGAYWLAHGTNIFPYHEGTLFIDCLDSKTNNLIWRGWATMSLTDITSPDKLDDLITAAVSKIFKKFPNTSKHAFVRDDKI